MRKIHNDIVANLYVLQMKLVLFVKSFMSLKSKHCYPELFIKLFRNKMYKHIWSEEITVYARQFLINLGENEH
jgi:hypothetical protein